jgi:hypothetical protein
MEDLKELLRKNLEVSERTLQLVERMHRAALWGRFFTLVKWVVIIVGLVWGYLAVQPYLQQILGISQQINDLQQSAGATWLDTLKGFLGGNK